MSATAIRAKLKSGAMADPELVFRQQADRFEEELLGLRRVPDDYLDLFINVTSDPSFASQSGAWEFVVRMYTDRSKLTTAQLQRILEAFVEGYRHYRDEKMRLVTCDFVARAFQPSTAADALTRMTTSAISEDARGPLRVGVDILRRRVKTGSPEAAAVYDLLKRLSFEKD